MRHGLRILLHLYEVDDLMVRIPRHIVDAEQEAIRFHDGEATGLITLRKQDAIILRQYQAELAA